MIGIRTSGAEKPCPFQVEVSNANTIVCHVGRVYDALSSSIYGTSTQKSWPANQNKITQRGLQKAQAYNRTELEYFNYSVKTNSAKIYYKGSSTYAGRGKATSANATNEVGIHGYVAWPRSGPQHEYIILHYVRDTDAPDTNKWCISAVEQSEIADSDIVIAYISNGEMVRQIWRSDVCAPDGGDGGGGGVVDNTTPHPFQIIRVSETTWAVREGTVNDVVASYAGVWSWGNYTVWLRAYPAPLITVQGSNATEPSTNESEAWVKIGRLEQYDDGDLVVRNIYQYVKNSLWLERFKCGDADAKYWFSQI